MRWCGENDLKGKPKELYVTIATDDLSLLPFERWMSFGSVSKMLMNIFIFFISIMLHT